MNLSAYTIMIITLVRHHGENSILAKAIGNAGRPRAWSAYFSAKLDGL